MHGLSPPFALTLRLRPQEAYAQDARIIPPVRPDPSTSGALRLTRRTDGLPPVHPERSVSEVEGPVLSRVEGPLRPLMFMFPTR